MTKLTDETLTHYQRALGHLGSTAVDELFAHINALTAELSQARAELAALRAAVPADGWRMVPVEPTREMVEAGRRIVGELALSMRGYTGHIADENRSTWPEAYEYRAMLAAAPQPPASFDCPDDGMLSCVRCGAPAPDTSDALQIHRHMTKEQFDSLRPGDVVQHLGSGDVCTVLRKRGDVGYDVTGRRGISIPARWALISETAAPQPPENETQATVTAWQNTVFGHPHGPAAPLMRAINEMVEACISLGIERELFLGRVNTEYDRQIAKGATFDPTNLPSEVAGIVTILYRVAQAAGFDLQQAVNAEMRKNRTRTAFTGGDGKVRPGREHDRAAAPQPPAQVAENGEDDPPVRLPGLAALFEGNAAALQPPAQAVAVRIKPLVWKSENGVLKGRGQRSGTYCVSERPMVNGKFAAEFNSCVFIRSGSFETQDEAMRACQGDYERETLSALDARPEAAVKAEALREMAALFNKLATHAANGAAILCEHHADLLDPPGAS